jgi:hypothetical protein
MLCSAARTSREGGAWKVFGRGGGGMGPIHEFTPLQARLYLAATQALHERLLRQCTTNQGACWLSLRRHGT